MLPALGLPPCLGSPHARTPNLFFKPPHLHVQAALKQGDLMTDSSEYYRVLKWVWVCGG